MGLKKKKKSILRCQELIQSVTLKRLYFALSYFKKKKKKIYLRWPPYGKVRSVFTFFVHNYLLFIFRFLFLIVLRCDLFFLLCAPNSMFRKMISLNRYGYLCVYIFYVSNRSFTIVCWVCGSLRVMLSEIFFYKIINKTH